MFAPYISIQLQKNCRIDLIWNVYLPVPDSLKGTTREKRGTGTRKRVSSSAVMPKNWKEFLREGGNETELFVCLSEDAACRPQDYGKELYATRGSDVLRSPTGLDVSNLAPCSHEEADKRLILHVADAVLKGHTRVGIRTVDTDVLVLAVASFDKIKPDELWVIIGTGSNLRCIAVHELVATMDPRCCSSLPIFHALTGCVTQCLPSLVEERRRHGQHGRHFQRLPMHSLSSNACLPRSVKSPCHCLRSLWCSCTIAPVT